MSRWAFIPYLGIALLLIFGLTELDDRNTERLAAAQTRSESMLRESQARDAWARYDTAISACERGNVLREQVAGLRDGVLSLNTILAAFMDRSAELRALAERDVAAREALKARDRIREIADSLPAVELVNCAEAVPVPFVARPPNP